MGRKKKERGAAERADGVGGGRNRGESFLERRVFRRAEEIHESEDCAEGRGKPKHPVEDELLRFGRHCPRGCGEDEQNDQTGPFESATRAWVHVRLSVAGDTNPTLVEAERQEGNPENVIGVESTNLHGAPRLRAGETIVVAKSDPPRAEMVHAVEDEQGWFPRGTGL